MGRAAPVRAWAAIVRNSLGNEAVALYTIRPTKRDARTAWLASYPRDMQAYAMSRVRFGRVKVEMEPEHE